MYGVAATSVFALLAFMNVSSAASTVFGYFVSLVTVFGTLNWINILVAYIGFVRGMKAQGIARSEMPYCGPLQPYGAYMSLVLTCLITFFNGRFHTSYLRVHWLTRSIPTGYNAFMPKFKISTFMTCYIGIAIYIVNIVGWKLIQKTKRVKAGEMDLVTDRRRFEEMEEEEAIAEEASGPSRLSKMLGDIRRRKN